MKKLTKKELDALRNQGANVRVVQPVAKSEPPAPMPAPAPTEETGAMLAQLSESHRQLAQMMGAALNKMAEVKPSRAPVSFKFDIERDARGLLKSITATPMQGNA